MGHVVHDTVADNDRPGQLVRLFGPGQGYQVHPLTERFHCVSHQNLRSFLFPGGEFKLPRGRWSKGPDPGWAPHFVSPLRVLLLRGWVFSSVVLWDLETGRALYTGSRENSRHPSSSLDGRLCTYADENKTVILDGQQGDVHMTSPRGQTAGLFSDDGRFFVNASFDHYSEDKWIIDPKFFVVDLSKKKVSTHRLRDKPLNFRILGLDLLIHESNNTLTSVNLESGEASQPYSSKFDRLYDAAGPYILGGRGRSLVLLEADGNKGYSREHRWCTDCRSARLSPDGRHLAVHIAQHQTHLLKVWTLPSQEAVLEFDLKDPAFDEYDSELTTQLTFDGGSRQLAALANGELLRIWGLQDGRWKPRRLTGEQAKGQDTYLGIKTSRQTVSNAAAALKTLGRVVRRSRRLESRRRSQVPQNVTESIAWVRSRIQELRRRWPHPIPKPFTEHNNRALSVRYILEEFEFYVNLVENNDPPFEFVSYRLGALLRLLSSSLRDGSSAGRHLHALLDHLTFHDIDSRQCVLAFYKNSSPALLEPIADREKALWEAKHRLEQAARREIEQARDAVEPEKELLWILPMIEQKAKLTADQMEFVRSRLSESAIRAACAERSSSKKRTVEDILQHSLHSSSNPPPPDLSRRLSRAFRVDLRLYKCKRCGDRYTSGEIKHNSICWGCWNN